MIKTCACQKWIALLVLLLAFALRLAGLSTQSFAFDEGWTSYAIHRSWSDMWRVLAPDNHPPLYYVLVKALVTVAGSSDLSMRLLSVFCGILLIATLYALGQRIGGAWAGIGAALFACCSPSFIYYAQEARMYSLLMALTALSTYTLIRALEDQARWWPAYVTVTAASLHTHYFALVPILAHSAIWLVWTVERSKRVSPSVRRGVWFGAARQWFLIQTAVAVLFLPWLPIAIRQASIGQGTWWRMALPWTVIAQDMWRFFLLGPRRPMGVPLLGSWLGPTALAFLAAAVLGWRSNPKKWATALLSWVLPSAIIVLIGSRLSLYTNRYSLGILPSLATLVGFGVASCADAVRSHLRLGRLGAGVLLLAAIAGPLPHLAELYTNPAYWREDFRRAALYLEETTGSGDTAILLGCAQPILHYYRGPANVLRLPQQGDSVQDEAQVVDLLGQYVQPESKVRLVMYSWPTVDPQSLIEGQLRAHCALRGEHWQQETGQRPIRIINFADCESSFVQEPREQVDAVWDGQVALSAYHLPQLVPGQRQPIILWWRTLRAPDHNYTVFIHLLDAQGEMISQYDKLPLSDFYPMQAWPLNQDQRDSYPLKVPEGTDLAGTSLAIGLYHHQTKLRLPVMVNGAVAGDSIRIPIKGAMP